MTEQQKQKDLQLTFETAQAILNRSNQPQSRIKQIANEINERPIAKLLRTIRDNDSNFDERLKEKENLDKKHRQEQELLRKNQVRELKELRERHQISREKK